jgi:hypothetical protein
MNDSPTTVRMAGSSITEVNFAGRLFPAQADSSFEIPESLVPDARLAGLVVAPEPAAVPAPSGPLVVALAGRTVTLDLGDLETRLRLLELSDWHRIVGQGYATFFDSTGADRTVSYAEATTLLAAVRRRQHAV